MIGREMYRAELAITPGLKIAATPAGIKRAVESGNYRWARLAGYAGVTVGEARKLYETATGRKAPSNITSRGRQFDGVTAKAAGASGRRAATPAKKPAARGKATTAGTSGRRGAKAAPPAPAGRRGRRGTRASADPK